MDAVIRALRKVLVLYERTIEACDKAGVDCDDVRMKHLDTCIKLAKALEALATKEA